MSAIAIAGPRQLGAAARRCVLRRRNAGTTPARGAAARRRAGKSRLGAGRGGGCGRLGGVHRGCLWGLRRAHVPGAGGGRISVSSSPPAAALGAGARVRGGGLGERPVAGRGVPVQERPGAVAAGDWSGQGGVAGWRGRCSGAAKASRRLGRGGDRCRRLRRAAQPGPAGMGCSQRGRARGAPPRGARDRKVRVAPIAMPQFGQKWSSLLWIAAQRGHAVMPASLSTVTGLWCDERPLESPQLAVDVAERVELVEHERVVALPEAVQVEDQSSEVAVGELAGLAQEAHARRARPREPKPVGAARRVGDGSASGCGLLRLRPPARGVGSSAGVAPDIWFTADPCYPGRYPDRASARCQASRTRSAIARRSSAPRRPALHPGVPGRRDAPARRRAQAAASKGAHRVPWTPSSASGWMPTGVASTGTSQASASSTARPKPSRSEGTSTALAALTHSGTRSGSTAEREQLGARPLGDRERAVMPLLGSRGVGREQQVGRSGSRPSSARAARARSAGSAPVDSARQHLRAPARARARQLLQQGRETTAGRSIRGSTAP